MTEKLTLPRERVRKDWYVGVKTDHADRSHSDVDDKGLTEETLNHASSDGKHDGFLCEEPFHYWKYQIYIFQAFVSLQLLGSQLMINADNSKSIGDNIEKTTTSKPVDVKVEVNASDVSIDSIDTVNRKEGELPISTTKVTEGVKIDEVLKSELLGSGLEMASASMNRSLNLDTLSTVQKGRRRLFDTEDGLGANDTPTVENDQEALEDAADASFDVFRDEEENMEDGLTEEYQYDYDDYVDEAMWGDENWKESQHEKEEDYVNIDAHVLCTPVSQFLFTFQIFK